MGAIAGNYAPIPAHWLRVRYIGGMDHNERKRTLRKRVDLALRLGEGMSLRKFAENAGISYHVIKHLRSEVNSVSAQVCDQIEAYLKTLGVADTNKEEEERRERELDSFLRNRLAASLSGLVKICKDDSMSASARCAEIFDEISAAERSLARFGKKREHFV